MQLKVSQKVILIAGAVISVILLLGVGILQSIAVLGAVVLLFLAVGRKVGTLWINVYQRIVLIVGAIVFLLVVYTTPESVKYGPRLPGGFPMITRATDISGALLRGVVILAAIGVICFAVKSKEK